MEDSQIIIYMRLQLDTGMAFGLESAEDMVIPSRIIGVHLADMHLTDMQDYSKIKNMLKKQKTH